MSAIAIISFTLFMILLLSLIKKGTDVFSPVRLFSIIWSFAIGLTELKLSWLQKEWNIYSWVMLFISLSALLLGMFSVYVINFGKPILSVGNAKIKLSNYRVDKKKLLKVIVCLFLAYIVSYITIYLIVGFIPLFTNDPNSARTKWSLFGFGLIIHTAPAVIYFILLYYLFVKKNILKKVFMFFIIIITVGSFILLLQRFTLVIPIVLLLVVLFYGTKKFKGSYIFTILSVFLVLIYSISTIRTSRFFILYFYNEAKMKYDKSLAFLTEPYMYITMNLENFANSVKQYDSFTYGYFTFDFILALAGLKHTIAKSYYFEKFPYIVNKSFNTYTMFFVYYRDFGILGLLLFPFAIGFAISSIYYWMRGNPSLHSISVYGMCVFIIIFTFFIPMLSWLHFVMNIIIIYVFSKLLIKSEDSEPTAKLTNFN